MLATAKPCCPRPLEQSQGTLAGSEGVPPSSTSIEARTTEPQCSGGAWIQTSPGVLPTFMRAHCTSLAQGPSCCFDMPDKVKGPQWGKVGDLKGDEEAAPPGRQAQAGSPAEAAGGSGCCRDSGLDGSPITRAPAALPSSPAGEQVSPSWEVFLQT